MFRSRVGVAHSATAPSHTRRPQRKSSRKTCAQKVKMCGERNHRNRRMRSHRGPSKKRNGVRFNEFELTIHLICCRTLLAVYAMLLRCATVQKQTILHLKTKCSPVRCCFRLFVSCNEDIYRELLCKMDDLEEKIVSLSLCSFRFVSLLAVSSFAY